MAVCKEILLQEEEIRARRECWIEKILVLVM
jgi:hypothetical protein